MGALPGIPEESGSGESNTEESSAARLTPAPPPEPLPAGPPEEYIDPISQEVMLDPVLLVETGQSYERATIEAWFTRCKEEGWPCTDPLTRQELRSCTVVPNFSLRSLISGWAERQRISDLPSFSKQVGRQRSQAHASGAAAAAAAALAGLRLGGSSTGVAATDDSSSSVRYPAVQPAHHQPDGPAYAAAALQQPQQGAAAPSGRPQAPPAAAQPQQHRPQDVHFEQPPAGSAVRPGLYPTDQQPMLPDKREQADTALGALRSAATQQGGTRGAAGYSAWTLQQLAGDAEGRDLLWEGNAIPLAIFLLGQLSKAPEDAALAAAAPALCAMLQRLGARDAGVASSISQCGGLHALVGHLTAPQPELRAAACRALYFLGWMGDDLRSQTLAEMEHLATLCKLPPKPLLALWRFWEQPAQQQGSQSSADAGGASTSSDALLPAGRAQEWESLALLLHMLAEGCSREARSSTDSAAAAAELHRLDVSSSAVPAALAHAAALSGDTAVRFAAQEAVSLLSQLPQNRRLLLTAALQQGQQAGQPAGAGRMCWLLWALCSHPSGGSRPAAVQAVAQQGRALLATLQAAFDPGQPAEAASRWLAAGLLTCLLHEPAVRGDGSAAAAADAVRRLLASTAAAPVLQNLLASLQPAAAAAAPQAARAAALAVANLSDFRGAAMSTALPAQALARTQGSQGSGDFKEWLSARLAGSSKRGSNLQPAVQGQNGSVGPGAAAAAAAMAAVEQQQDPQQQQQQQQPEQQATQAAAPLMQQPTDPRGALLFHGAMQALAALVASSSAAAAASDAAARGNGAAGAPGTAAALTPDNQQQVASAAAEAAEAAAQHRAVLCAALLALNNLCADPTAAAALRSISKAAPGLMQQLQAALTAALGDRALPEACRGHARLLLQTLSGVPGQRHQPACTALAAPQPAAAYPNP